MDEKTEKTADAGVLGGGKIAAEKKGIHRVETGIIQAVDAAVPVPEPAMFASSRVSRARSSRGE